MKIEKKVKTKLVSPDKYICNMCSEHAGEYSAYLRLFGEYCRLIYREDRSESCFEIHLCEDCSDGYFDLFLSKLKIKEEVFK